MTKYLSKSSTPIGSWIVGVFFLFLSGVGVWQFGNFASTSILATLGAIGSGIFFFALLSILVTTPSTSSSIGSDGEVTFTWRYLTHSEHKIFHWSALSKPKVVERVDSDGDSHWSTQLVLPDGTVFVIAKNNIWTGSGRNKKIRKRCEVSCAKFIEDLARESSPR